MPTGTSAARDPLRPNPIKIHFAPPSTRGLHGSNADIHGSRAPARFPSCTCPGNPYPRPAPTDRWTHDLPGPHVGDVQATVSVTRTGTEGVRCAATSSGRALQTAAVVALAFFFSAPRKERNPTQARQKRRRRRRRGAMERAVPVRKPHTSTADLLTWSATGPDAAAAAASPVASSRPSLKVSYD